MIPIHFLVYYQDFPIKCVATKLENLGYKTTIHYDTNLKSPAQCNTITINFLKLKGKAIFIITQYGYLYEKFLKTYSPTAFNQTSRTYYNPLNHISDITNFIQQIIEQQFPQNKTIKALQNNF